MYYKILEEAGDEEAGDNLWSFDDPRKDYYPENASDDELDKFLVHALSFEASPERGRNEYVEGGVLNEPPYGSRLYTSWDQVWRVISGFTPEALAQIRIYDANPQREYPQEDGSIITDQVAIYGYYTIQFHPY